MEALGINLGFLISQIVNFTLLAVLLYVLLYRPILRMLGARTERIRQGMEDAERAEKRAAEAQAEYERLIEEARREGTRDCRGDRGQARRSRRDPGACRGEAATTRQREDEETKRSASRWPRSCAARSAISPSPSPGN